MIFLLNDEDVKQNYTLIPGLSQLYNLCFPDINEREDFNRILDRVKGIRNAFDPDTVLILYAPQGDVIAGMVVDWYRKSKSIHVTYIFVHPESRNKGIARRFLNTEISSLIKLISDRFGTQINSVFLESNIPTRTEIDSFDPSTRLKIFRKIGIKWIDIPYVQPALGKDRAKVKNLYLLTIPVNDSNEIKIEYVIGFLNSLYKSLEVPVPEEDPDYNIMLGFLNDQRKGNDTVPLKPIP